MRQAASIFLPLISFFILLFVYTKLAGPIPFSVNSITTNKTDSFTVSGEGKVTLKPDLATVNLGVQASGLTVKQAQDQINVTINQVSANIKKLRVDEKDIQTSSYNISPTYDYQSGTQKITGYSAGTNLVVKVRDLNKINTVIDEATKAGANQVYGISFDVDDKTKAENEARQKAVVEAKNKAAEAARIASFSLGKIINYSESFGGAPRPIPLMAQAERQAADKSTNLEPGSSEITVTVNLSYEVR